MKYFLIISITLLYSYCLSGPNAELSQLILRNSAENSSLSIEDTSILRDLLDREGLNEQLRIQGELLLYVSEKKNLDDEEFVFDEKLFDKILESKNLFTIKNASESIIKLADKSLSNNNKIILSEFLYSSLILIYENNDQDKFLTLFGKMNSDSPWLVSDIAERWLMRNSEHADNIVFSSYLVYYYLRDEPASVQELTNVLSSYRISALNYYPLLIRIFAQDDKSYKLGKLWLKDFKNYEQDLKSSLLEFIINKSLLDLAACRPDPTYPYLKSRHCQCLHSYLVFC